MRSSTETLISALRILAKDIQSGDGVANQCMREVADRLEELNKAQGKPVAWMCPNKCGCLWRDNKDGTMSLFGQNSRSCAVCEALPLDGMTPLYTVPPKRHPLSDDEIIKIGFNAGFAVDWDQNEDDSRGEYGFLMGEGDVDNAIFIKFVKAIEKAHGIGD